MVQKITTLKFLNMSSHTYLPENGVQILAPSAHFEALAFLLPHTMTESLQIHHFKAADAARLCACASAQLKGLNERRAQNLHDPFDSIEQTIILNSLED